MADPKLIKISKIIFQKSVEIKLYRDRFDLAYLIKKLFINNSNYDECDPIKMISFMTWEAQNLPEKDCKIVAEHFKSIENIFKSSKEDLNCSLNSLKISDKSKHSILTFLTGEQDYYID
jgi:hypothetical protein